MAAKQHDKQEGDLPSGLAQPAIRALEGAGCTRIDQVAELSLADLKKLHGMGPKALDLLRAALDARGLSFADEKRERRST